jgi:biopolymer transport protein ExbD
VSFLKLYETKEQATFRPQLTSLIDVMTILLVFLIKSFSVEGNLVTPSKDLELPFSTSSKPPTPQYTIDITKSAVIAEGTRIATLEQIGNSDSMLIEPLYEWMKNEYERLDSTGNAELLLQCDRDIIFSFVKKVMYSCSKAGFSEFSVLVIQEEK